jgi:hypothetical protein
MPTAEISLSFPAHDVLARHLATFNVALKMFATARIASRVTALGHLELTSIATFNVAYDPG